MFLTGEFSRIARVSKRLLQYYDEIGLLKPAHTDPQTGYRYYSARQLPRLNRILALKELGLSLEQIARMLDDAISDEEIRGMLVLQRAQLEQSLIADLQRFRQIESRLRQDDLPDVVLKSVPAQRYLSLRTHVESLMAGWNVIQHIVRSLPTHVGTSTLGHFVAITHTDLYEETDIDVQFGFLITGEVDSPVALSDTEQLTITELPAVETMATIAHVGGPSTSNVGYGALGQWIEANNYRLAGAGREVFLDFPFPTREEDFVIEIQFPVESVDTSRRLLPDLLD